MLRRKTSRPLAVAAASALAAAALVSAGDAANASFGGGNGGLTASSVTVGGSTISIQGAPALNVADSVRQASWSPDGSRAVYASADNHIRTVRFDNGKEIAPVTVPSSATQPQRSSPTWVLDGKFVMFAEKSGTGGAWRLMLASSAFGVPKPITPDDGFNYTNPDGGINGMFVFQKQAAAAGSIPEIWSGQVLASGGVLFANQRIGNFAANPAISPDGTRVVFANGTTIESCATGSCSGSQIIHIKAGVNVDDPAWSPDGKVVAYRSTDTNEIFTMNGADPKPGLTGVPAYRSTQPNEVVRLFGANRFVTAIATSQSLWVPSGKAKAVVLSRSDLFADALGGAALAAAKGGPLLLTSPASLDAGTEAEIERALGGDKTKSVYLLGGPGAISSEVEARVQAMGYQVKRLSGADRFATAIAIADEISVLPERILVATGKNFPDALAAGAAAGAFSLRAPGRSAVVVLSNDTVVPASVEEYLKDHSATAGVSVFGIGGQGDTAARSVLGSDKVIAVAGSNRYDTARLVAKTFFGDESRAGIATGSNWPDALAGGALMGTLGAPLLLTPSNSDTLVEPTRSYLTAKSGGINQIVIFGGSGVVNTAIEGAAGTAISGPAGFKVFRQTTSG